MGSLLRNSHVLLFALFSVVVTECSDFFVSRATVFCLACADKSAHPKKPKVVKGQLVFQPGVDPKGQRSCSLFVCLP